MGRLNGRGRVNFVNKMNCANIVRNTFSGMKPYSFLQFSVAPPPYASPPSFLQSEQSLRPLCSLSFLEHLSTLASSS